MSEYEKKPYSFGGHIEVNPAFQGIDKESVLYKIRFPDGNEGDIEDEHSLGVLIDLSLQQDITEFFLETNIHYTDSYRETDHDAEIYQGYLSLKPSASLSVYAGKKTVKWGKGYAWNPVGFVERPKDPNDPDIAREGFIMLTTDYTRSYSGALRTVSFSPVIVPVEEDVNEDFGEPETTSFGGKLYLLLYDTDIDLMFLAGDSKPDRYGMDFSKNLTSNFEVHGELSFIDDHQKDIIDENGDINEVTDDATSYLIGLRYLTAADTTYILEYYHNGKGFTEDEMDDFYSFAEDVYQNYISTGDRAGLNKAKNLGNAYGGQNPMRDYLYMRISHKEPFEVLYLTPALTGLINLNDRSYSLSPELLYSGITNTELRLKGSILAGMRETEYGEKQNDYKVELLARYYF
ncbi:MAG: hypothetical protein KAR83_04000 [Thermodesulfovibrionales bacterium]|nr:hypothetical protein [Thermodesulfovibrionales bacterium]